MYKIKLKKEEARPGFVISELQIRSAEFDFNKESVCITVKVLTETGTVTKPGDTIVIPLSEFSTKDVQWFKDIILNHYALEEWTEDVEESESTSTSSGGIE